MYVLSINTEINILIITPVTSFEAGHKTQATGYVSFFAKFKQQQKKNIQEEKASEQEHYA